MIRRILPAVLAAALIVALAGCGERKEPTAATGATERVDLVLDYIPNADHAGIYTAIDTGEFKAAGLDVRPRTPSDPAAPFGGTKQSGLGREGAHEGMMEFLETQYVSVSW